MIATVKNMKLHAKNALSDSGRVMYCNICGSEYSANYSDYFMTAKNYVFKCCDMPCELAQKIVTTEYVSLD